MSKCTMIKICEYCSADYTPVENQETTQKYCSRSCKDKNAYQLAKSVGHIKAFKSGFPRATSIRVYMKARNSDISCPCHYCGTRLYPDNFQLDHMVALPTEKTMSKEKWRKVYREESNLVVCCSACNRQKGSMDYKKFKELKQNAKV